jgi:glycosyltransferase involved in cell wall biosynthesis
VRIGLIVTGGLDRSGRERVVPALLWLVERLARRHDLHVFVLHYYRDACSYPLLGATVHDIGRVEGPPGLRRWRVRARLAQAIAAAGRFDVLQTYLGVPAMIAAPIAERLRVPLIVTFDSGELVSLPGIGYGLQRRWLDRRGLVRALRVARRIAVSTRFMAEQPAIAGHDVSIIPLGVEARLFPLETRTDGPPWRLLRVASLNPVKDYSTLLHAMRRIVDHRRDVHLDIVGEDTMHGVIHARAAAMGLRPHVTFHGFQPTDQLASFYARAHLHIVSSRHEAAGVAVLEAAATGLATVGTRVGYVADWAPERAEAVPVGDAEALANAIIALLQDPARRARVAASARAWTLEHDADWTARQVEALYEAAAR